MEKVILFNYQVEARQEITEFLENKGYSTLFAEDINSLISLMNKNQCKKSFIYVKSLTDIRQLQTIRSLYIFLEINLIIPPHLKEIIKLLKNNSYNILDDDLTNL